MAKATLKGNVQAFAGLTDRIEGKVTNKLEMDNPGDDNRGDGDDILVTDNPGDRRNDHRMRKSNAPMNNCNGYFPSGSCEEIDEC